jgi:metal-responsive CopG/Arc/MetJ family transcriptional regulator
MGLAMTDAATCEQKLIVSVPTGLLDEVDAYRQRFCLSRAEAVRRLLLFAILDYQASNGGVVSKETLT